MHCGAVFPLANTIHRLNAVSMFGQRRCWCTNIYPTLGQGLVVGSPDGSNYSANYSALIKISVEYNSVLQNIYLPRVHIFTLAFNVFNSFSIFWRIRRLSTI